MITKQTLYAAGALVFYVLALLSNGSAQYEPQEWPIVTLRFSDEGTLKDIFDSGLRPYRFPTLEQSILEAKHARVTVLQRNGQPLLEFPAEQITISPLQGGLLESIEMTRYKTTLEEARMLMLPYLQKSRRNAQELDRYLAAVKANYLDYDGRRDGVEEGGPGYVVAFRKAFDPGRPLIFFMLIDWSQLRTPRQNRSFYKEPIPAPPGYEDVSMQAPKRFGPDSQADILLSQGKPIAGDRPPSETPTSITIPAPSPPVPAASPPTKMPVAQTPAATIERNAPMWPWVVGSAALIVIVALALKRRA